MNINHIRSCVVLAVIGLLFFASAVRVFGATETTGTISGTVRDSQTGAPIANAKVTGSSPSQVSTTSTDSRGFYILNGLSPDTYTVSVRAKGYNPISQPGVVALHAS